MDLKRVETLLKFILLTNGENSIHERSLCKTNLIKYLYLADLEYAALNHGETYTGIDWRFLNFGPWSSEAATTIDDVISHEPGIQSHVFKPSGAQQERECYSYSDAPTLASVELDLPSAITLKLRSHIHRNKNNLNTLLQDVYNTQPMLCGKPGNTLDFHVVAQENKATYQTAPLSTEAPDKKISKKKLAAARKKVADLFEQRKSRKKEIPVYDQVYHDGMKWLDSLQAEGVSPGEIQIQIPDEFWDSSFRKKDHD